MVRRIIVRSGQRPVAAILTAAALVVSAACSAGGGGAPAASGPTNGQCTADTVGGNLTMGTFATTPGLDPMGPASEGVFGGIELTALYDTLMAWDTATKTYVPRLAERLESDPTATRWTLTLRPGVTFGNGDPFTADAVKASIERHRSPDNRDRSRSYAQLISAMTVVDPRTLEFTLGQPWTGFPFLLASDAGMVTNPAVVAARGADFTTDPAGAGAGPYEVLRYAPGEELVLTAKPDYWDGPTCIQQLRFVSVTGAQATYDAFRNGELDLAFLREPQVVAAARQDGYADLPTRFNATDVVVMNSGTGLAEPKPPTADARVREAVAAAIDPAQLNQRVFDGTAVASTTLVPTDAESGFAGIDAPAPDAAHAKTLVADLKNGGWDGHVRLLADKSPTHVQLSIAIAAQLEAAGFVVDVNNSVDIGQLSQKVVTTGDYDLALFGLNIAPEGLWARLSPRMASNSPGNIYRFADPQLDTALGALRTAGTRDQERAAVSSIQTIWNSQHPGAIIAGYDETVLVHDYVRGLHLTRAAIVRFEDAYRTDPK